MATAIAQIDAYFADPKHHVGDLLHVKREQFAQARGVLGSEADALLTAFAYNDEVYKSIATMSRPLSAAGVSISDLHRLAQGAAPRSVYARLVAATHGDDAGGVAMGAAQRYSDVRRLVGENGLGVADNAAQTQALLALCEADVVDRYKVLARQGIDFGASENASLVRFILARGGPDVIVRYRELMAKRNDFRPRSVAALAQAIVAMGPPGSFERYRDLARRTDIDAGVALRRSLVLAILANAPADAIERFKVLKARSTQYGWIDQEGLVRAILATASADTIDRYHRLADTDLRFGWIENSAVARALLAAAGPGAEDRYRDLFDVGTAFGRAEQAGVTQALLASGCVFTPVPAIPAATMASDDSMKMAFGDRP